MSYLSGVSWLPEMPPSEPTLTVLPAEQPLPPLVRVEKLGYRYAGSDKASLSDICLSIPEGSCFGLLGPNGAGKTTLISLLTGLLPKQSGDIRVGEWHYPQNAEAIKGMSALVPQEYAFYPSLTARENFRFFAGLYRIPRNQFASRMEECVTICGLGNVLDQRAENYSGGIKRRLNLALGLLSKPRLLYLDEPTVGIDAQSRHFILEAIQALQQSGMTIVYTSHYMEEVEQICDDVAIIDEGRVVLQEPTSVLLQGGQQIFVTPTSEPSTGLLDTLCTELSCQWENGRLVLTPGAGWTVAAMLSAIEQQGVEIERLQMGEHRLEEVYLGVTRTELRS
jgi:ABC-2 type transport system ATP-binding protein